MPRLPDRTKALRVPDVVDFDGVIYDGVDPNLLRRRLIRENNKRMQRQEAKAGEIIYPYVGSWRSLITVVEECHAD